MSWLALFLTGTFTIYPGPNTPDRRIEAITDHGTILELIVRCPRGNAIISYSKSDRLYCGPRWTCDGSRDRVIREACG